jgi:hypothetical protein
MNAQASVRLRFVLCALVAALLLMTMPLGQEAHATGNQFFTITPCRAVDTRIAGGAIPANGSRSFYVVGNLTGQGGQSTCGIPSGATGVFLNAVAVAPSAPGHLTIYPWPGPLPSTSTLNFTTGQTVANGALIPICDSSTTTCSADLTVTMGPASAHIVIDVTGYIAPATASTTSPPVTVGWFKIVIPYTWHQSNGPMPIQIGAMIDDGNPQPLYKGTVTVGMLAFGRILTLYDSNMNPLPNFQTTAFANGGWYGYVMLQTSTGATQDLGLRAVDPVTQVAGGSNPVTWMVP